MTERIAIIADSCCDLSAEIAERYNITIVPLIINYSEGSYRDGVDISAEEVYERLKEEVPTSSLPEVSRVVAVFDRLEAEGYEKFIVITLSSGLSGTNNLMNMIARERRSEIFVFDTKNIAIGAGFYAIYAASLREREERFATIISKLEASLGQSKVFFALDTLEYLKKGGRIGLVTSLIGTAFDIKPIISCNEEGIYYTVAKIRSRAKSLKKLADLAREFVGDSASYYLCVSHGYAADRLEAAQEAVSDLKEGCTFFCSGQISPVLGVHTGPGLIGIGVMRLDED